MANHRLRVTMMRPEMKSTVFVCVAAAPESKNEKRRENEYAQLPRKRSHVGNSGRTGCIQAICACGKPG